MNLRNRKIGIVGGMGPAAGFYFAQKLTEITPAAKDQDHPIIFHISNSAIPDRTAFLTGTGEDPVPAIAATLQQLEQLGADVLCMPCNTTHAPEIFERLVSAANVPIINMVDEAMKYTKSAHPEVKTVGILGTNGTLAARSYDMPALQNGITTVIPSPQDQQKVMDLIYKVKGRGPRHIDARALLNIMDMLPADAYMLACTELSILSNDVRELGKAIVLDSLEVLAKRALDCAIARPSAVAVS